MKNSEETTIEQEETVEALSELEQLQADYAALNDRYLRTLAEYDNFRKRTQKDIEAKIAYTKSDILGKILPVIDNFERAAFNSSADSFAVTLSTSTVSERIVPLALETCSVPL